MSSTVQLDTLFTIGGLLDDRDGDGLPDGLRMRIVIGSQAQLPEHLAAVDLAARLGFASLALELPLVCSDRDPLPAGIVPLFVGRPTTVSPTCPARLSGLLAGFQQGEGLVAVENGSTPALLVGGSNPAGLAAAVHAATAWLPHLPAADTAGADLPGICRMVHAAAGGAIAKRSDLRPEALIIRQGRVVEVRLRATLDAVYLDAVRAALSALPERERGVLPCDVAISFDTGTSPDTPDVQIRRPAEPPPPESGPGPATARADNAAPRSTVRPEDGGERDEWPALRSLACLYGPAGLAIDTQGDLLPDTPRTRILLPHDLGASEAIEAAHLGARIGLESLGLALPLAGSQDEMPRERRDVAIWVAPLDDGATALGPLAPGEGEIRLVQTDGEASTLYVRGSDARGRERALRELAHLDAWTPEQAPSLAEVELALRRLCTLAQPPAWICAVRPALLGLPREALAASPEPLRLRLPRLELPEAARAVVDACIVDWVHAQVPGLAVDVDTAGEAESAVILDETRHLSWEVDDAWARFEAVVLPALAALAGRRDWLLDVRISEPAGRRYQIKREMVERIRAAGLAVSDEQVRILPAYRQGRAWLLEEVAPKLGGRAVAALTVRVRRFAPDYPCLELPVRWLQDLHPVDELLAERLRLPRDAVRFEMADMPTTYEAEARNADREIVWRSSFEVIYGRRPYLGGIPEWGTVHPPTGCVRLLVEGKPVVDARIAPDPERVWDLVQEALLPRLREHILTVTGGVPRPEDQPFFGRLTVDAWLSEDDAALGVREERDSPLESLHEDLYFMLLDYCAAIMGSAREEPFRPPWVQPPEPHESRRGARLWTAPGLIIPRIHRRDGAPGRVRLQLTAATARRPQITWSRGGQTGTVPLRPARGVALNVVGLHLAADETTTHPPARRLLVELTGPEDARQQAGDILAAWHMLRSAGVALDDGIPAAWAFSVLGDGAAGQLEIGAATPAAGTDNNPRDKGPTGSPVTTPSVPWDRVLGLPEIEAILHALGRSPRVRVYRAGHSARGRPSYAVEVTVPRTVGLWSRAKLSAWKCTLLLNARHHANEPSSTSALLRLAELLASDETWRRYLDRVNVVLVPCENPDGAALHYALQDEHPTWMLHAGRYNAAGLEFSAQYANPETCHTEARVLPALWRRWAPDIVCDDHGFPSHEWVQPFAGHSNPWFRSYWIPQGLIFAILPRIRTPRYPRHAAAADSLRQRLVRALADDPDIRARNSIYADRYRTFLHSRLPDAFPAPYDDDVLIHVNDYDPDDPGQSHAALAGFPGQHPGVTTASLITEVADETAQGRYMARCAHAHLVADRVLLDYLFDVNAPAIVQHERWPLPGGAVLLRAVRPRPALAGPIPSPELPSAPTP
jgi:hypothetical protein